MLQHPYQPETIPNEFGTHFVSEILEELSQLLEIKIQHASLKHPQTIGVVERAHGTVTRSLKTTSNPTFTNWHSYLNLVTFIHNTSCHATTGSTLTFLIHERAPTKLFDLLFYGSCMQCRISTRRDVEETPKCRGEFGTILE